MKRTIIIFSGCFLFTSVMFGTQTRIEHKNITEQSASDAGKNHSSEKKKAVKPTVRKANVKKQPVSHVTADHRKAAASTMKNSETK